MTLDAPTRQFVEQMAQKATKSRAEMTPQDARVALTGLRALIGNGPSMMSVHELAIPVEGGSLSVRVLVPSKESAALLVYYHGGGWVIGSPDEFEPLGRHLAAGTGCAVAMVNYRKAPEFPYPTPVNDAWTALTWLAGNIEEIVGRPVPLLVGGDSAGANLAIAMTFRARANGSPVIKGQLLVYPVTDCDLDRETYKDPANQLTLTRESMSWYWNHYVPNPDRRREPEASPLRNVDFQHLPPAVVITAEHDILRDEGEEYVRRLRNAGVSVSHRRFEGQMHSFLMMIDLLPGSAAGLEFVNGAFRQLLSETK